MSRPTLARGENTVTFSAGPQEGTVTIEGTSGPLRLAGPRFDAALGLLSTYFTLRLEEAATVPPDPFSVERIEIRPDRGTPLLHLCDTDRHSLAWSLLHPVTNVGQSMLQVCDQLGTALASVCIYKLET